MESVPLMLHSLSGLNSLTELKLKNCNLHDGDIPSDISCLSSLEKLELGGNNFISVPASITLLSRLQYLGLSNCREIKSFPEHLINPPKVRRMDCSRFNVLHCYKMVENTNVLTMLYKRLKVVAHLRTCLEAVMPGSEILKWFSHQTVGSSIKIPLSNNIRNDSQWIGVIFCCIFVNDDASREEELACEVVIRHRNSGQAGSNGSVFSGINPRRVRSSSWIFSKDYNQPIIKDHFFYCYFSHDRLYPFSLKDKCGDRGIENLSTSDCSNQEFDELQFSITSDDCHRSVKVKKCGIRLVYQKDLEDINEDSTGEGSVANGSLIKRKRDVYEEMDAGPQPKRMGKFFNSMMGRQGKKH
ncbi:hypothetical protein V6N13_013940 [Hibiscus sabdariffa]|uniref:C-JID domain-containing protein n=1 Tax=Hibiscus sabdariffa TaxID=183260 RepID=A0ABR2RU26_9ROSI